VKSFAEPSRTVTAKGTLRRVYEEYEATGTSLFTERVPDWGPVQPSNGIKNELQEYLAADSPRAGDVYRLLEEGLDADATAELLEGGAAVAWQYRRMVRALIDESLPRLLPSPCGGAKVPYHPQDAGSVRRRPDRTETE
jgi:hypothetical protein